MKIKFCIDQAALLRDGIDGPNSMTFEKDPASLDQETRNLLAARIDNRGTLYRLRVADPIRAAKARINGTEVETEMTNEKIVAKRPTFESLMEAVREDEERLKAFPIPLHVLNSIEVPDAR